MTSLTIRALSLFLVWLAPGWAALAHPGPGIALDAQGRIYFTAGPMIVVIETNGAARTIVHDRNHEKFYQLHHIQRAPDGGLLTASDMGNAIWRFDAEGHLTRFYPPAHEDRLLYVGLGGDPFAVDDRGNIYAVNSKQDRFTQILKVTPEGQLHTLAGGAWGFADGRGTEAQFGDLHGGSILALPEGVLLVTDHLARVRRIAPDGTVTTLAGARERGYADGPGPEARFDGAIGLALDGAGNVLVVEQTGRIRKISSTGLVTTLAGSGRRGTADGPLLEATFDEPTGIAVAPNGDLFVLEPNGPRVRKITGEKVLTIHRGLP